MTDPRAWEANNTRHVSTSVGWLRLCLEQAGGSEPVSLVAPPPVAVAPMRRWPWWRRVFVRSHAAAVPQAPLALPPGAPRLVSNRHIAEAAADVAALERGDAPPALVVLSRLFGLSDFERNVLLLCVAMELDTSVASLCARALRDPSRPYPTFALAMSLFAGAAWDALAAARPLRYWRLIEITQRGAEPLLSSALRADERIVGYVKGLHDIDDRIAAHLAPLDAQSERVQLPPTECAVVDAAVRAWEKAPHDAPLPILQLAGPDARSKQLVASSAASRLGRRLCRMPADMLPSQPAEIELLARLWQRESILSPLALYIDAEEHETVSTDNAPAGLARFVVRTDGFVFVGVREPLRSMNGPHVTLDVAKPSAGEQHDAWTSALGDGSERIAGLLAGQFSLDVATIDRIATASRSSGTVDRQDELWQACRESARPRLDALAQRLEPRASWRDLVLARDEVALLRQIAGQVALRRMVYEEWGFARVTNRGLGIAALFAGESGTGKTMAAEVIANELRLSLYRIDLSQVVSKYIGETEKNLRRVFDGADDGGAILFFDEADALFGKRSEVKDSHDRYANIEINYLLQRIESYRGLAILATNMKSAMDDAFVRRLRFIVSFPFPGAPERRAIWERVFPAETPCEPLDLDRLARFNLTGGSIRNVAVNAAFLAASARTAVSMPAVLDAVRTELRKLERPLNEADFVWRPAVQVPA